MAREAWLSEGIHGNLRDLSLAELLQALHIAGKDGTVEMSLRLGRGALSICKGEIVAARYAGAEDEPAFFAMLDERDGTFSYAPGTPPADGGRKPIGQFMNLLMEGLVRIDEDTAARG
jgi:hypothetical protein